MKWKSLQMPKDIQIEEESLTDKYSRFTIEPLERGFGTTLGHALRRTLLSSIQGVAPVALRIDGVLHAIATIPGVYEDVTEIVLNVKRMRLKLDSKDGKKRYQVRMSTVEPLHGDMQKNRGFTQFALRGLEKVNIEYNLLAIAHNIRKILLHRADALKKYLGNVQKVTC